MGGDTGRLTRLVGLALILSADGCVAKMYTGPARPIRDTALLEPKEALIRSLDGLELSTRSRLAVLPGAHALIAKPTAVGYEDDAAGMVCFWAQAGHRYEIRPGQFDAGWRAAIVDEATGTVIPIVPGSLDDDCLPAITRRAGQPSWAAELSAGAAPPPLPLPDSAARGSTFPIGCEVGVSIGSGEIGAGNATGQNTLHLAGTTASVSLVAFWTPLWFDWFDRPLGLGLGASIGVKGDLLNQATDGEALSTFPATGDVHAFVRLRRSTWLLLRAGVEKDLDLKISGGAIDTHFATNVGSFGELAIGGLGPSGTAALGLRYTALTYFSQAGEPIQVDSLGFRVLVGWRP